MTRRGKAPRRTVAVYHGVPHGPLIAVSPMDTHGERRGWPSLAAAIAVANRCTTAIRQCPWLTVGICASNPRLAAALGVLLWVTVAGVPRTLSPSVTAEHDALHRGAPRFFPRWLTARRPKSISAPADILTHLGWDIISRHWPPFFPPVVWAETVRELRIGLRVSLHSPFSLGDAFEEHVAACEVLRRWQTQVRVWANIINTLEFPKTLRISRVSPRWDRGRLFTP